MDSQTSWSAVAASTQSLLSILPSSQPLTVPSARIFTSLCLPTTSALAPDLNKRRCSLATRLSLTALFEQRVEKLQDTANDANCSILSQLSPAFVEGVTEDDYSRSMQTRIINDYVRGVKELRESILLQVDSAKSKFVLFPVTSPTPLLPSSSVVSSAAGIITPDKTVILQAAFARNAFVTKREKERLASATKLEPSQVGVWFSNQRQRRGKKGKSAPIARPYPAIAPHPTVAVHEEFTLRRRSRVICYNDEDDILEEEMEEDVKIKIEEEAVIEHEASVSPTIEITRVDSKSWTNHPGILSVPQLAPPTYCSTYSNEPEQSRYTFPLRHTDSSASFNDCSAYSSTSSHCASVISSPPSPSSASSFDNDRFLYHHSTRMASPHDMTESNRTPTSTSSWTYSFGYLKTPTQAFFASSPISFDQEWVQMMSSSGDGDWILRCI